MHRSTIARLSARPIMLAVATSLLWLPTASLAQSAPAPERAGAQPAPRAADDTVRLSDAERNGILDTNTAERAAAVRGESADPARAGRAIHGEVGATIGSNGMRGAYGVAEVPLGDDAGVVVSFESSRYGSRRR